jgi:aminoglycoside 6'-N-acetyltransferase I
MIVRPAQFADHQEWLAMRMALWSDCPADEHVAEMRTYAGVGECQMAFVADVGFVCGFVEASLRQTAEGCTTSPADTTKTFM